MLILAIDPLVSHQLIQLGNFTRAQPRILVMWMKLVYPFNHPKKSRTTHEPLQFLQTAIHFTLPSLHKKILRFFYVATFDFHLKLFAVKKRGF